MRDESLRLLVYEYMSGGGFTDKPIPSGVLSEGFAMLRSLIEDFKGAGHAVSTTLDSRIAKLNPPIPADDTVSVTSLRETHEKLRELSEQADAAYVIAPETDGVLQSLVEVVKQTGATSLNCQVGAIAKVSDKARFYEFIKTLEVPLPKTMLFSVSDRTPEIMDTVRSNLGFPVVFKPVDGVSCGGVSVARNEEQVDGAIDKIKVESAGKHLIAQKLVEGTAASVTVLSTGSKLVPISLNRQNVRLETPDATSTYSGGAVPFDHPLQAEAFEAAEKLVKSIPGLRGYVGVDFVLTDTTAVVIEVNPRLTTSYLGLKRVVNFNPAQAIVDAVLKHKLPAQIKSCGYTVFSKVETPSPTVEALQELYRFNNVVSPPFPVSNGEAAMLMMSHGGTLQEASLRFHEAKKRVLNIISRGK